MQSKVIEALTQAAAKALATTGPHGVNVVPISMIKIDNDTIWLFDFFMNKTVANIKADPAVALTAWTSMTGVQIKALASYVTEGEDFEAAVKWVETQNPDRLTRGLLMLKPTAIYDISPGGVFMSKDLAITE